VQLYAIGRMGNGFLYISIIIKFLLQYEEQFILMENILNVAAVALFFAFTIGVVILWQLKLSLQ